MFGYSGGPFSTHPVLGNIIIKSKAPRSVPATARSWGQMMRFESI
jgi:hypothetical protein